MLNRPSSRLSRGLSLVALAVALALPAHAQEKPSASDDAGVEKRGRITPFNGAAMPEGAETGDKSNSAPDKKPADGTAPSGGVGVFDRMGAELPALPAEKPFAGKVDDAYGAFQRGYYLTAMDLA